MHRFPFAAGALFGAIRIFATEPTPSAFCFDDHLPGYYAVVRQTATERAKVDKNQSPLVLSTDGLSGVKNGLFIGTAGVYLDKQEAGSVLSRIRKTSPDAYLKFLGNYSNRPNASFDKDCPNCWDFESGGKVLRGRFLAKKGWLLQQSAAADHLLASAKEPAESHLCSYPVASTGWLLREESEEEGCCTETRFKILGFDGAIHDEKSFSIGDGPQYQTIDVVNDSLAGPKVILSSNGKITEEWSIARNKFTKAP